MGHLYYGTTPEPIHLTDRLLSQHKVIFPTKIPRSESYNLSWTHVDGAPGRSTLWLQPAIPLRFVFDSAEPEQLNAQTLKDMADMANSSAGLMVALDAEIPATAAPVRTSAPAPRRSTLRTAA